MKFSLRQGSVLAVIVMISLIACEKADRLIDIIKNPPKSIATFELAGSDSNCLVLRTPVHIMKGKSLSADHKMQVVVNVSKTGNWKFSSDTLNNFYFTGHGTFSTTGQQTIILEGKGTPTLPGNFYFTVSNAAIKHRIMVPVLRDDVPGEDAPEEVYFKAKIDGVEYIRTAITNYPERVQAAMGLAHDSAEFIGYVSNPDYQFMDNPSINIRYLLDYPNKTEADFKKFFSPRGVEISPPFKGCKPRFELGLNLSLIDSATSFTTFWAPDQEGSWFNIVSVTDGRDIGGLYYVKVKLRFECKLYEQKTGQMKQVKDGEMVCFFAKIPPYVLPPFPTSARKKRAHQPGFFMAPEGNYAPSY